LAAIAAASPIATPAEPIHQLDLPIYAVG